MSKMLRAFFFRFSLFRFFSVFHLWGSLAGPFFSVFHSVFFPFSTRGSRDPWTPLRTPEFFNLSGYIFPHENPTRTHRFGHIWALHVPGQVWPSTARAPVDRFFSVFHSVVFPFSVKNALSVFHLKNGNNMEMSKMENKCSEHF